MSKAEREALAVEAHPATSYWLAYALRHARDRDVCDALADAEELVRLLTLKLAEEQPA